MTGLTHRLFELARQVICFFFEVGCLNRAKDNSERRWQSITDNAENMARFLCSHVGEAIARSNDRGDKEEEQNVIAIQQHVSKSLEVQDNHTSLNLTMFRTTWNFST